MQDTEDAPLRLSMTGAEVAELLGCSGETVKNLARRGDLPAFFLGNRRYRRYREADVLAFVEARCAVASAS